VLHLAKHLTTYFASHIPLPGFNHEFQIGPQKSGQVARKAPQQSASDVLENTTTRNVHCWNKMCLTLPPLSFDDNKVLKCHLDMLIFVLVCRTIE